MIVVLKFARVIGFEPIPTVLETAMLPLHQTRNCRLSRTRTCTVTASTWCFHCVSHLYLVIYSASRNSHHNSNIHLRKQNESNIHSPVNSGTFCHWTMFPWQGDNSTRDHKCIALPTELFRHRRKMDSNHWPIHPEVTLVYDTCCCGYKIRTCIPWLMRPACCHYTKPHFAGLERFELSSLRS